MGNQAGTPSTGYKVGKWLAGNRLLGAVILAAVGYSLWLSSRPTPLPAKVASVAAEIPITETRQYKCGEGLHALIKVAEDAAAKKDFNQAYVTLDYCVGLLPKDGVAYKLRDKYAEETRNAAAAAAAAIKAAKKKEGVRIGMSERDALDSSWGRPEHINTTTTANGTSSQWVYGYNYLYFTNGVLTSIQN